VKVILTAAGAMCRWKLDGELYGGVPKHLIPIGGEPLLWRTVRLLRERDVTDILIVGPDDPRYAIDGARLFVPADHVPWSGASRLHDCDKFLSSRSEWKTDGRTVILHGDVYLAEDAADSIVGYERREWYAGAVGANESAWP
jgi:NDP-sugar pyrophosphorylase family protein